MKTKYRIRKKGLRADGSIRYSVERILRGKVIAITLPKAKKLYEMLSKLWSSYSLFGVRIWHQDFRQNLTEVVLDNFCLTQSIMGITCELWSSVSSHFWTVRFWQLIPFRVFLHSIPYRNSFNNIPLFSII